MRKLASIQRIWDIVPIEGADRIELAKLLNISEQELSYITNVGSGQGLIKIGSSLIPFINEFPKNTELYKLMTTKPQDLAS